MSKAPASGASTGTQKEWVVFWYFGYGSNMNVSSLRAKGVEPKASERAILRGWRLRFNVQHFFRHEGGVGNIERADDPETAVWGVVHLCEPRHLALLDAVEAYGHGYDRVEVRVATDRGERQALTYVGMDGFIDDACLPSRRYMNILIDGASAAGIDDAYIEALRSQPVLAKPGVAPFRPPPGDYPTYTAQTLVGHLELTALDGAVFDMSGARWQHRHLQPLFGGRDMTLFHLRRLDASDGTETLEQVRQRRFTPEQRRYLDEYLHEYSKEYVYAGRFEYE